MLLRHYMRFSYKKRTKYDRRQYTCTKGEFDSAQQQEAEWLNPLLLQAFELPRLVSFVSNRLVLDFHPWETCSDDYNDMAFVEDEYGPVWMDPSNSSDIGALAALLTHDKFKASPK